jgi:acetylornithine/N-succinyldiaminopimelate aminotransferase
MSETTMREPGLAPPTQAEVLAEAEIGLFVPVYALPRLELVSGRGARVRDASGREYLDFTSGIAVSALGHAPAGLGRAIASQMRHLVHTSNLFANRPAIELARALVAATGYERVFFCNSGAEGVESALKFARAAAHIAGRPGRDLVAFRGGFHGRTGFALSATWTPSYREPFQPLIPGVRFGEFNDVAGLETLIDDGVAAVIVEPIQGESGAVPATAEFLRALRERTEQTGAWLILDEVQSGMGRSGHLLAAEHFGVRGEVTVLSKALGAGVPLAAVLLTARAAEHLAPGMHGSTFGGGPVATTAGRFVLERVNRPSFLARVRRRATQLERGLDKLRKRHASIREARGLGLLRAIELREGCGFDPPELIRTARRHGLLLVRGGERAVRLLPPLVVTPNDIRVALERLDATLNELESRLAPPKEIR